MRCNTRENGSDYSYGSILSANGKMLDLLVKSMCMILLAGAVIGCGSSSSARAGLISITNVGGSGQLTSLAVGSALRASMTPINDRLGSGIDWSVTCGGSPLTGMVTGTACGSFSPVHTSDGGATTYTAPALIPVGSTVTLTASVTSDPSASTSITLPVDPLPITVAFVNPPTTVQAGSSVNFVVNALNDTSGAGVTLVLSCGSSAPNSCGTFTNLASNNTTGTYNAPASVPVGGTVSIKATSVTAPAQSANITLTVEPPSAASAVSVSVSPATFYVATVGQGHTNKLVATVTGDATGAGVTWTLSCGSPDCGSTPQPSLSGQTVSYRGPSAVPIGGDVTITATSVADPTKTATSIATVVTVSPVVISFSAPPPADLAEGASATLIAAASSGLQGIVWSVTCGSAGSGACGSFSADTTSSGGPTVFTAPSTIPSGAVVTITAALNGTVPANSAVATTTITAPAPTITFTGQPPADLTTLGQATLSATVNNDVLPGGVTWTLTCASTVPGGCGSILPSQTADGAATIYTAPPVPLPSGVTITAASTGFPSVSTSSAPVTITASTVVAVQFVPFAPSQLVGYQTVNLDAGVINDASNAGVDWQVCADTCGFFTTAPAVPEIPATATTPLVPAIPAQTATTVLAWPNGLPIPYTAPQAGTDTLAVTITAAAHADLAAAVSAVVQIQASNAGPALHGSVRVGSQPVVGASVALYAAGTLGYGSASTQLYAPGGASYAVTGSDGTFTVEAGYLCPGPGSEVYLVSTGGRTGAANVNPNSAMMTALGPCSNLSSSSVTINEVTTVGSVWPLAQFAANNPLTGQRSVVNLGSTASNLVGLADAFASVNNLVDVGSGNPRYNVPAANAAVPYVEINTLAAVLNSCTSTSGGVYLDGTACGTLFSLTAPLGNGGPYNGTVPTDTLQAAFNIAQHPDGGLGYGFTPAYLYGQVAPASPFQPVLAAAPADWSLALNFTGGGGLTSASGVNNFAIDGLNNLWMTDTAGNSVIEWTSNGVPLSPSQGFAAGRVLSPGPLALDTSGDVWITGANGLTELYARGTPTLASPFNNGGSGLGLALDALSNIWITNSVGVSEFNSSGSELSPVGGYLNAGVTAISTIAIDQANHVLVGDQPTANSALAVANLNQLSGQALVNTVIGGDFDLSQTQLAVDGSGTAWIPAGPGAGSLCKLPPYGGLGTQQVATCYSAGPGALNSLYSPRGVAIDGSGAVWFGNAGGAGISPNVAEILPSQGPATYAAFVSDSLAAGPLMLAIDGSGNIWVLLSGNTITEYIGIARPTVTPLAAAVTRGRIGKTP